MVTVHAVEELVGGVFGFLLADLAVFILVDAVEQHHATHQSGFVHEAAAMSVMTRAVVTLVVVVLSLVALGLIVLGLVVGLIVIALGVCGLPFLDALLTIGAHFTGGDLAIVVGVDLIEDLVDAGLDFILGDLRVARLAELLQHANIDDFRRKARTVSTIPAISAVVAALCGKAALRGSADQECCGKARQKKFFPVHRFSFRVEDWSNDTAGGQKRPIKHL
ncbi:hypothetical protein Arad_0690 [Rhizobium rhizogenes K84]|uniref:Uncharacterized protein n=1 Tax=Rhizobium rhizogenes (strain K84 / ATCC BAA-868) TaxID=311403 RepID=B9J8D3_RHIR8|nr:hypothetical protein Arad_0690 [Rhizobium rhizogenes K84]